MEKIILFLLLIMSSLFSDPLKFKNYLGDGVISGQVSYSGNLHSLYLHNYDNEVLSSVQPYIYFSDMTNVSIESKGGEIFGLGKSQISLQLLSTSNALLQVDVVYRSLGGGEIRCDLELKNISAKALFFDAGFDIVSTNIAIIIASNEAVIKLPSHEQLLLQSKLLSLPTNMSEIGQADHTNKIKFKKILILESGESFKVGLSIRDRKKRYTPIDDKTTTWWQRWLKKGLVPQINQGWLGAKLLESLVVQKGILLNGRSPIDSRGYAGTKFAVVGQLQIADMFSKYGFYQEASDILNNLAGKLGDLAYPLRIGEYLSKDLALIDSYYSYLVFDNFVRSGKFAGSLKLISKQFLAWNKLQNSEGLFASNDMAVYSTTTHLLLASGLKFAAKLMALARNRSLAERFLGMSILTTRGLASFYSDRLNCYLDIKSKQPLTELELLYPFIFGTSINKKLRNSGSVVTRKVILTKRIKSVAFLLSYYALQGDLHSFLKVNSLYILFGRSDFLLATIGAATQSIILPKSDKWFYKQFKNRFFVLERLSSKLKGVFLYREIKSRLNRLVDDKNIKKDLYKLATLLQNFNAKVQNMNFDRYSDSLLKNRVSKLNSDFVAFITHKVTPIISLSEAVELTPFNEKVIIKLSTEILDPTITNKHLLKIVKPALLDMTQEKKRNDTYLTFSLNKKLNSNQNMIVKVIVSGREKGVDWSKSVTRVIKYRYPLTAYLVDNGNFLIIKNNLATGDAAISLVPSVGVTVLDSPAVLQAGKQVRLAVNFDANSENGEYPINIGLRYKGRKFYKTVRVIKKNVVNVGSMIE